MEKPQRLSSGKYRARVYIDGKRVSIGTFNTSKEAKAAMAKAHANEERTIQERVRGGERFETFAERVLFARKRKVAPTTWKNYQRNLRKWIMPYFRDMKLRDISPRHVDEWFAQLPEGSPTNGQRYAVLALILKRAVKEREISATPAMTEGVSSAKSKVRPTWTWDHFQMLYLGAADDMERALIWVLGGSGCRIGEALALNREDVDLADGSITVAKHLTEYGLVEGTKAHKDQVRVLTMPQKALDALRAHLENSHGAPDDPLFTNARGGRMAYDTARRRFNSLRESRLLFDFNLHDLRHLHLSTYAERATLREVMERGGHSDMRTALRYQHPSRTRDREIVAAMNEVFQ